jgi:2'-5' RNA ligase
MSKRVVVTFPAVESPAAWSEILAVRARFDPLAGAIAPHFTLVFPFDDGMSDDALEQHLRTVAAGARAFPVLLRGITAHEGEYLFLNVKQGNDAILALHDALYRGPLAAHHLRTNTFVPHITVGRLAPLALSAALDATASLTSAIHARVEGLSVYAIEPDGMRRVLADVPLPAGV